jgi:hypothetical protein
MDAKLLKEFEEMEGLSKETLIDPEMVVNDDSDDDDGGSFKPVAANSLSSSDIYNEVRSFCKTTRNNFHCKTKK